MYLSDDPKSPYKSDLCVLTEDNMEIQFSAYEIDEEDLNYPLYLETRRSERDTRFGGIFESLSPPLIKTKV